MMYKMYFISMINTFYIGYIFSKEWYLTSITLPGKASTTLKAFIFAAINIFENLFCNHLICKFTIPRILWQIKCWIWKHLNGLANVIKLLGGLKYYPQKSHSMGIQNILNFGQFYFLSGNKCTEAAQTLSIGKKNILKCGFYFS